MINMLHHLHNISCSAQNHFIWPCNFQSHDEVARLPGSFDIYLCVDHATTPHAHTQCNYF